MTADGEPREAALDAPATVLRAASAGLMGLVHPEALADPHHRPQRDDPPFEWEPLEVSLAPDRLTELVERQVARWAGAAPIVAASLLVREITGLVIAVAVDLWGTSRRVLDLSLGNLELACTPDATRMALRQAGLRVVPGDPLAGAHGVTTTEVGDLRTALLSTVLDETVPAVIESMQSAVRTGTRHLWGNVALGIANGFTSVSHTHAGADDERRRFLAHRPELARTIELVTVDDGLGGALTCALRRNCCLLDEVDRTYRCATCSLDHDPQRRERVVAHYLAERRAARRVS